MPVTIKKIALEINIRVTSRHGISDLQIDRSSLRFQIWPIERKQALTAKPRQRFSSFLDIRVDRN